MKKIGFFGGCFNPPTSIHLKIANDLISSKQLDKVVFIPVNDYYNKKNLELAVHRVNMLKLLVKDYTNLEVDDIELKEKRKLYAIDAFEIIEKSKFKEGYNKENIFLIMGSDNFSNMPNWKGYNEIKDKYNYIVIERNKKDISSTIIRKMIKEKNIEVKKYLSKEIYKYILDNNLYKE